MTRGPARDGMARVLRSLLDGPVSVKDWARMSGLSESATRQWVKSMRETGAVRVCYWDEDPVTRRRQVMLLELNPEGLPDVKQKKLSDAERQANYKRRQKLKHFNRIKGALCANPAPEVVSEVDSELRQEA